MRITGPESVVFGVDDMDAAQKFGHQYGLVPLETSSQGASFRALDGSGIDLRLTGDRGLARPVVDGPTARLTVWGVEDALALQEVAAELSKDREVHDDGTLLTTADDDGNAIGFRVTQRHQFDAPVAAINSPGRPPARGLDHVKDFKTPGQARVMGHIVFWSADPEQSMKFYVDRLKFRITDRISGNGGVFARAASHADHHSIFFLGGMGPARAGFQHLEFQFQDIQEVVVGGNILTGKGWKTHMGPGCHLLGSNWYWYFYTPMGGAFELSADMDKLTDAWQPRVVPRQDNVGLAPQWEGPSRIPPPVQPPVVESGTTG